MNIEFHHRRREWNVRSVIEPLVDSGLAARAGINDLEIGYSTRNAAEWDIFAGALNVLALVETTEQHVKRARHVQRLLAVRSQRARNIPDLLVAAAAEEVGGTVLHCDADSDLIADVTGQPCEWVAPPGSID